MPPPPNLGDAQFVWCEDSGTWVAPPTPVECSYGNAGGGPGYVDIQLGQERLSVWVVALSTGELVDHTVLTGPAPTEADCKPSVPTTMDTKAFTTGATTGFRSHRNGTTSCHSFTGP